MRFTSVSTLVAGLSALAYAAPNEDDLFKRAACNRDNCLRQVVASSAAPGPAQGSADCSVFLAKTISLCPTTVTVTAPTATFTATATASSTNTIVASTFTPVVTVTATETQTVTVPSKRKRAEPLLEDVALNKRLVTPTCTAATITNTAIPTYASSCRSPSQYSSACSCDGITTAPATTLPQSTITITNTPSTTITASTTLITTTSITLTTTPSTTTQTVTVTSTTTSVAPVATSCNAAQSKFCSDTKGDVCVIEVGTGQPKCFYQFQCVVCSSNSQCSGVPGGVNTCAYDAIDGYPICFGSPFCIVNDI